MHGVTETLMWWGITPPPHGSTPHFAAKLATVRSLAELDGFAAQKRADGATDEEVAAIARRRVELQREGRA